MAPLKLTDDQAEFFLERLLWNAESILENNSSLASSDDLAKVFAELEPLVRLGHQLSERELHDSESLRPLALLAIDETRENLGSAVVNLTRVKAGDKAALHWPDEENALAFSEDSYNKEIEASTKGGVIAQTVFEAIVDGDSEAVMA